jgi:hypothetical protein
VSDLVARLLAPASTPAVRPRTVSIFEPGPELALPASAADADLEPGAVGDGQPATARGARMESSITADAAAPPPERPKRPGLEDHAVRPTSPPSQSPADPREPAGLPDPLQLDIPTLSSTRSSPTVEAGSAGRPPVVESVQRTAARTAEPVAEETKPSMRSRLSRSEPEFPAGDDEVVAERTGAVSAPRQQGDAGPRRPEPASATQLASHPVQIPQPAGPHSEEVSGRVGAEARWRSKTDDTAVRITIGRIEVRAEQPTPTTEGELRTPRRRPVLSLDDYLRRRSGGDA